MKYETKKFKNINYIIRFPKEYTEVEKYSVIFFLHGAGSRGKEIDLLKNNPFFTITEQHDDFPFIVVAPQCSVDTWFDCFEEVKELVLMMIESDIVDSERVYAMGASMGGYGVWQLGMSLPDVFSAIIPICGGGMYWNAYRLAKMNVWAFHGADDPIVLPRETQEMVKRVNDAGGNAKYTIYENTEHDSWSATYANSDVFSWLLQFKTHRNNSVLSSNKYNDSDLFG